MSKIKLFEIDDTPRCRKCGEPIQITVIGAFAVVSVPLICGRCERLEMFKRILFEK